MTSPSHLPTAPSLSHAPIKTLFFFILPSFPLLLPLFYSQYNPLTGHGLVCIQYDYSEIGLTPDRNYSKWDALEVCPLSFLHTQHSLTIAALGRLRHRSPPERRQEILHQVPSFFSLAHTQAHPSMADGSRATSTISAPSGNRRLSSSSSRHA